MFALALNGVQMHVARKHTHLLIILSGLQRNHINIP